MSTRNAPGIGTLCQALYLKNYWSYDHETSQDGRGQKTVEPKKFLLTSDYPTSGYKGQRQIFMFSYKCSNFIVFFCRYEVEIFTSRSNHVWEYVIAIICHNFLMCVRKNRLVFSEKCKIRELRDISHVLLQQRISAWK